MGRDTQRGRRAEITHIRSRATAEASRLADDPFWVAGVVLYWGEGSKASNRVELSNADPRAILLFMGWVRRYLDPGAEFVPKLNLHGNHDDLAARRWWAEVLGIDVATFYKTYRKPDGTGHRKNTIPFGVVRVTVRRSTDDLHRVLGWIDGLARGFLGDTTNMPTGR
jgi:hypothetical protein